MWLKVFSRNLDQHGLCDMNYLGGLAYVVYEHGLCGIWKAFKFSLN